MSQVSQAGKKLGVKSLYQALDGELEKARQSKTYKVEVPVDSIQGGVVAGGRTLANHAGLQQLFGPG